jgi:molybdate transport system ATP-binding protein
MFMKLSVDIKHRQGVFQLETFFHVEESSLGIFGPSGCGKSTLFRAISGLLKPDEGRIVLDDDVLLDTDQNIFVPPYKRNIGLVFQDARLFPHWSVEKNLRAGEYQKTRVRNRPFSFEKVVDLLQIQPLLKRPINGLSGGEQQRIALGRALLSNPRLLLMDEPVTGLDAKLKREILPFLSLIHTHLNIPCILISHDMTEILQLSTYLLLMRGGRLVVQGTLLHLVSHPEMLSKLRRADLMNVFPVKILQQSKKSGVCKMETTRDDLEFTSDFWDDVVSGQILTVGISPSEMALALQPVENISMCNQVEANVIRVVHAPERSLCLLKASRMVFMVEITPESEKRLELGAGKSAWILFKSKAIRRISASSTLNQ